MKKLRVLFILALSVAYISCEDAYDIQQEGLLDEDVTFLTVDDMDAYLNGIYANESVNSEIAFTSIFTDETGVGNGNNGQGLDLYKLFLTNNDGYADAIWLNHYSTINYVARLIRGAGRITPTSPEETAQYNSILAEAKALRAFANIQLMAFFAEDMKNDASPGIILLDRVPQIDEELPRNSTGEIWAFVESDLNAAEASLIDSPTEYFYITKNAINAMRARMYAYRGMYTQAMTYADEVIDNNGVGLELTPAGYLRANSGTTPTSINQTQFYNSATSNSDYRKMWADGGRYEIIWGLTRQFGGDAVAANWFTNATTRSGGVYFDMGRNLFNLLWDQNGDGVIANSLTSIPLLSPTDHDVRSRAFIDQTSLVSQTPETVSNYINNDVLVIDKYPGTGGTLRNNLKLFRLSEMYLIRAEAQVANGDLPGAAATLKEIRDARTYELRNSTGTTVIQPAVPAPLPDYAGNAAAAWADILLERRKELCFEGHRYIDLRRLGALAGGVSFDRYPRDCTVNQVPVCGLDLTDHRYILPIPVREIIGNSVIDQNPGY